MGNCKWIVVCLLAFFSLHSTFSTAVAQNMPHEAGFWLAVNGQMPLGSSDNINRGFFTNPTIEHLYYSFESNGVQSLAIFAEHVGETREWSGMWTNQGFNGSSHSFPATVNESLEMTTIGLETVRTLISENGFRLAGGLGLGYGLGDASAEVRDTSGNVSNFSSAAVWDALLISVFIRAKYAIVVTPKYEISLMLEGRYWGFPAIGPVSSGGTAYNGPGLRAVNELGYLAGISIGF